MQYQRTIIRLPVTGQDDNNRDVQDRKEVVGVMMTTLSQDR